IRRHRRLYHEVAGASANFRIDEARMRTAVSVHAGIHDPQLDALRFGEHADGGSALQEIGHHLHGHFARIGADTVFRNTMVRGKHDARWLKDAYAEGSLNRAHLRGERLEPAKSA